MFTFLLQIAFRIIGAFATVLPIAQKSADFVKTVEEVMPNLHFDKRAEHIQQQQEQGRNIVLLAAVESSYNFGRGLLQVFVYGIMTWGVSHIMRSFVETLRSDKKKER